MVDVLSHLCTGTVSIQYSTGMTYGHWAPAPPHPACDLKVYLYGIMVYQEEKVCAPVFVEKLT
jgi:hypothetical protein